MRPLPIIIGVLWVVPVTAQRPAIAPAPSVLFAASAADAAPGSNSMVDSALSRDPRELGAGIGAMAGLVAVYGLSHITLPTSCPTGSGSSCDSRWHSGPAGYLAGAAIGAGAGYLIGRLINGPYHRPRPPSAPLPNDTGVKAWQGALVGVGVGAFALPVLVHGFHLDRGGDGDAPIIYAPIGALIGAFVGAGGAAD